MGKTEKSQLRALSCHLSSHCHLTQNLGLAELRQVSPQSWGSITGKRDDRHGEETHLSPYVHVLTWDGWQQPQVRTASSPLSSR